MKFAFIQAHANEHAIRTLCRVLAVSKAGYYAWCRRAPSARATATRTLTIAIEVAFRASTARYGSPQVHRELRAHGQYHSRKRVAQIMQGEGWRAVAPKRYRVTTDSRHTTAVAPNQLARVFAPPQQAGTNRVWVGDVTYVATRAGWLYLAVLLDLASRRVVVGTDEHRYYYTHIHAAVLTAQPDELLAAYPNFYVAPFRALQMKRVAA